MRIALILRGISYIEDYEHRYGIASHTVDFRNTMPSIHHHLIRDLELSGHKVDVFLLTYPSKYSQTLIEAYKPVAWKFKEYKKIPLGEAQIIVWEPMLIDHHLECMDLFESYEKEHDFKYDHVLITRFDLFYYQKMSDIAIEYDKFNYSFMHIAKPQGAPYIFSSEDNFLFYPRSKNDVLRDCFMQMKKDKQSTTLSGKYLKDRGEPVHYIFGEKGDGDYDYPFYKFARHIFGNAKEYTYDQIMLIPMNRCHTIL